MAQVLLEKPVLFCGIWRPKAHLDDTFLRAVSSQFDQSPAAAAKWSLTAQGLTIVVNRSESGKQGQTDRIPAQSLLDTTVNRYNPHCLMTSYLDPQHTLRVIVCRCDVTEDAAQIINAFQQLRKSVSVQGYGVEPRHPPGINWTLRGKGEEEQRDHSSATTNGSLRNQNGGIGPLRSALKNSGLHDAQSGVPAAAVSRGQDDKGVERNSVTESDLPGCSVGVQTEVSEDDMDDVSVTSDMSVQSMKDEITSLSTEVRDLKLLLEQTTGISAEELYRRSRGQEAEEGDGPPRLVPIHRVLSTDSADSVPGTEKKVNFAAPPDPEDVDKYEEFEFDVRSVGLQAGGGSRLRYAKRPRAALNPAVRYQPPGPAKPPPPTHALSRHRAGSTSSTASSSSSTAHGHPRPTSLHNGSLRSHHPGGPFAPRPGTLSRGGGGWNVGSGTVVKPIEAVYQHQQPQPHVRFHHQGGSGSRRRQVVLVRPRSASTSRIRPGPQSSEVQSPAPAPATYLVTSTRGQPDPAAPKAANGSVKADVGSAGQVTMTAEAS